MRFKNDINEIQKINSKIQLTYKNYTADMRIVGESSPQSSTVNLTKNKSMKSETTTTVILACKFYELGSRRLERLFVYYFLARLLLPIYFNRFLGQLTKNWCDEIKHTLNRIRIKPQGII